MLFVGSDIYLMNDTLKFESIDKLAGEFEAVQQNGYFYFIAIHPSNGRQVFGIKAFSLRTSTNDEKINQIVKIYPNPVSDHIQFENLDMNYSEFTMYNMRGEQIQKGIYTGEPISITMLQNGQYFIVLGEASSGKAAIGQFSVLR